MTTFFSLGLYPWICAFALHIISTDCVFVSRWSVLAELRLFFRSVFLCRRERNHQRGRVSWALGRVVRSSGIKDVAARVFQPLEIPLVKEKSGRKTALKHLKSLSSVLLRWFGVAELKIKTLRPEIVYTPPLIVFISSARPSLLAVIKSACWRGIGLNCKAGAWKSLGRPRGGVSESFFYARCSC